MRGGVLCATGYFKENRQATYSRKILWKDAFGQDKVDGIVDSEADGNNVGKKPGSQSKYIKNENIHK